MSCALQNVHTVNPMIKKSRAVLIIVVFLN
jgi:hypothetical protein